MQSLVDALNRPWVQTGAVALASCGMGAYLALLYQRRRNTPPHATVLCIRLTFVPGGKARFLERWAPLARYCQSHERNTITYEVSESLNEPETIVIYERYPLRRHLTDIHNHSKAFKELNTWLESAKIVKDRTVDELVETNIGYHCR